ncbi:MAG: Spy/CpxP family protein refolding chaperone [Variibacter sp.]
MLSRQLIVAAAASLSLILPAAGQPAGGPGWMGPQMMMGPGMMRGPGMWGAGGMCSPRMAGLAEWRIDQIERAVKPTEAQQAALAELRAASVKAAEGLTAACPRELPKTSEERLAFMEKRMDAMLQALKTVRPAFSAFYASLDEGQKASLDEAGPRHWGWRRWNR